MTKKDYELVAKIVKGQRSVLQQKEFEQLCHSFAIVFSVKSSTFNEDNFLAACGLEDRDEE